jgi:hypothetical protein
MQPYYTTILSKTVTNKTRNNTIKQIHYYTRTVSGSYAVEEMI